MISGRRRHYRRVFPIMVGAYMVLSSLVIPLGFKFMALLGLKSILISSISFMVAIMGGIKKYMGSHSDSSHSSHYPSPYPAFYPSYYDPWRRDEFRKLSNNYDDPTEFSNYIEETEWKYWKFLAHEANIWAVEKFSEAAGLAIKVFSSQIKNLITRLRVPFL